MDTAFNMPPMPGLPSGPGVPPAMATEPAALDHEQVDYTPALRSAVLDVINEARERWGEVVGLPVDLGRLRGSVGALLAEVLPGAARPTVVRAADAEPALWAGLRRGVLVIEVPMLATSLPWCRPEPGDADLTPRLVVQYPGRPEPRRLVVGGLSRQFWRERAAVQRNAGAEVDLLLTHRAVCCHLPAAALVSVQA